ncbi:MAG: ATP-binding protein, partial [Pirellulales bacterium]
MKLISVTIRQYKVHEYVHIDFDAARNVIGAPNESGKSTIVEAIHHALFLRSRVTGLVQKAMLSEVYSGYPTVELRFEIKQMQYTITKIFSGGQSASTTLQQHSSRGRTLRNEEAEEMIHDLLQTEEIGGGRNLDARLRMQWAHLWIWQGTATEDPLDHANIDQHATSLRNRLAQIEGGGVLESALDATVSSVIKHRHHATFTEKGKPRS